MQEKIINLKLICKEYPSTKSFSEESHFLAVFHYKIHPMVTKKYLLNAYYYSHKQKELPHGTKI